MSGPLVVLAAVVLSVLGTARATRLWIYDKWPPVAWARDRFLGWAEQTRPVKLKGTVTTAGGFANPGKLPPGLVPASTRHDLTWRAGWAPLATCPFCVAPWFALASLVWLLASGALTPDPADLLAQHLSWAAAWWVCHAWFALSYLAAMVVVRDEPADG